DHRDLRDRINAVREAFRSAVRLDTKRLADRQASLLHRGRGERGKPDHISDGINVGDRGSVMRVNDQAPAVVRRKPRGSQIEFAGGAGAAYRIEGLLGENRLAAVEMKPDARAVPLPLDDLQLPDALVQAQGSPVLTQMVAKRVGDFRVDKGQQPATL